MHTFVTLFDAHYLSRGLAMIRSLLRWMPESHIVVLCIDKETQDRLNALKQDNLTLIYIEEALDDEVLALRQHRTLGEFCWTLTPIALEIGLRHSITGEVTYLDADLFFFNSPQLLLDKIINSEKSITITPHDFSPHLMDLMIFGKFCVQWITIIDNEKGLQCLVKYKQQCLEWCHAYMDEGRFGDQKYLDAWPEMYKDDLLILEPNVGFGAPWNMIKNTISFDSKNTYIINDSKLIFFHFHQFKIFRGAHFFWCSRTFGHVSLAGHSMFKEYETAVLSAKKILGSEYVADLQTKNWLNYHIIQLSINLVPVFIKKFIKKLLFRIQSFYDNFKTKYLPYFF